MAKGGNILKKANKPNPVVGTRGLLITNCNQITLQHVEQVCDYIEQGDFLDTAVTLVGIEPATWYRFVHSRNTNNLSRYAFDAVLKSQAQQEHNLRKKIMDPQQYNAKLLFEWCEKTNPKLQKRVREQIKYDNAIMLRIVLETLGIEAYTKVLEQLSQHDPYQIVAELDNLLLHG